jgi:hypothetical protein
MAKKRVLSKDPWNLGRGSPTRRALEVCYSESSFLKVAAILYSYQALVLHRMISALRYQLTAGNCGKGPAKSDRVKPQDAFFTLAKSE